MQPYNFGTKSLKSNASATNTFGKVNVSTNTAKTNDYQLSKLKNKAYGSYGRPTLKNRGKSKTF